MVDLLTVSETAIHPPEEESGSNAMNSPKNLSLEATYINHNFTQQVLHKEERYKFDNENPFLTEGEDPNGLASVAYRFVVCRLVCCLSANH